MKQGSTLFLKAAVILIGIPILALCIFGVYWITNNPVNPNYAHMLYPILIGIFISAIPFYFALYQSFRLLNYIDQKNAFSQLSVKALKNIKYCALIISSLYLVMMPFVCLLAKKDDAPGLIIIATVPIFASLVVAVFTAVLHQLLKEAIEIKSENDLTI